MTPTTSTRSPRPRGAARRTALLDATLAVIGERGTDAVTHRAVAQRADLPLASTTYWFQSKEDLLTEALRHAADTHTAELREAADRALAAAGDEAPIDRNAIVGVVLGSDGTADPCADRIPLLAAYSLMLEAARRPALQAIAEDWTQSYLTTVGALLARAGSARPVDDARLLMAATDGLLIDRVATGDRTDGDGAHDLAADLRRLLDALLGAAR